jgi:hypothetical protein
MYSRRVGGGITFVKLEDWVSGNAKNRSGEISHAMGLGSITWWGGGGVPVKRCRDGSMLGFRKGGGNKEWEVVSVILTEGGEWMEAMYGTWLNKKSKTAVVRGGERIVSRVSIFGFPFSLCEFGSGVSQKISMRIRFHALVNYYG